MTKQPPGLEVSRGVAEAGHLRRLRLPHIATGELLRDHVARRTALGLAVQDYLDRGELVPDQVVLDMVREAMVAAKAAGGGFVLDGIPRNMRQARAAYLIGFLGRRQYPPSCVTHAAQLPDVLFRRRGDGMRTLGLR